MDQTFSAPCHMASLAEVPRPQDLQVHYDAIAQGVKPYSYHTPAGSPYSTSHSFHDLPPVLSASSESSASVSSSTTGSPSTVPQFNESWSQMNLGFTSSYDYPAMVATEKSYVGESTVPSTTAPAPFAMSPAPPFQKHVFKTPIIPASAKWPSTIPSGQRNFLLSNEMLVGGVPPANPASVVSIPCSSLSPRSCWLPSSDASNKY
jgi:hypothetical protein